MVHPPRPGPWDVLALASAVGSLALAYFVVPSGTAQYGAWLVVFSIWMLWFVSFGVRWLYGDGSGPTTGRD